MKAPADVAATLTRPGRWDRERRADVRRESEYAGWLAGQCPICEEGGGGPECDPHVIAEETIAKRRGDI